MFVFLVKKYIMFDIKFEMVISYIYKINIGVVMANTNVEKKPNLALAILAAICMGLVGCVL